MHANGTNRRRPLFVEPLEDRTVPSNIVWVNQASAANTFTPAERVVIKQAIAVWSNLVVDLHTSNNELDLTILGGSSSGLNLGSGTLAETDDVQLDSNSRPTSARIRVDASAGGYGWFVDPTPADDSEFPTWPSGYHATGGPDTIDLYTVVLHEMGHALGFIATDALSAHQSPGPGNDWTYTGAGGLTAVFDPDAVHLAGDANPNDLMSPDQTTGERFLPSDLDVRILADAYGYTVNLPVPSPNFESTWQAGLSGAMGFTNEMWTRWSGSAGWRDVQTGDFNGDGRLDVTGRTSTGQWWVGLNTGASFADQAWGQWNEAAGWQDVHSGNFTGDGKDDIIGVTASGQWWLAKSTGKGFINLFWSQWNPDAGWQDVRFGDFVGNGLLDVAARTSTDQWWVGVNTGSTFAFQLWTGWMQGAGWRDIQVGDFTGDGKADLLGRTSWGQWWLARSNGHGFDNIPWGQWYEGAGWQDVVVGDFTGNGKLDIAGRTDAGEWWVAVNTGMGSVNQLWGSWDPSVGWRNVLVGDFSGDGKDDILAMNFAGQWQLGRSTGSRFTNQSWGAWDSTLTWVDILPGDFNKDGKTDVIGRTA